MNLDGSNLALLNAGKRTRKIKHRDRKIGFTCLVYILNTLVATKRGEKSFLVKALKVLRAIFLEGHPSLPLDTAWKMKESVDFSAINIPKSNVLIYEEGFNVEGKKRVFFQP